MGAVSLVLFAASGYAQTYKATMGQVAPTLPAAGKNTAVRPFKFHASDERLRTCAGGSRLRSGLLGN